MLVGRGVDRLGPASVQEALETSPERDQPLEGLAGKAEGLTSSPGNEQPKPNTDLQPRPPATWQLSHVQEAPA